MINGVFCAANYELNTTVLRGEWGYDGLVKTDWWPNTAKTASGGFDADRIPPVIAKNDVFMENDSAADTVCKMLENTGNLRGALFRNAKNILRAMMKTPAFEKSLSGAAEIPQDAEHGRGEVFFEIKDVRCGAEYEVNAGEDADYTCAVTYRAQSQDTVQIPVVIFVNGERYVCMLRGTEGAQENKFLQIPLAAGQNKICIDNLKKRVEIISIMLYNAK